MFGKILTVVGFGKTAHTHLYKTNEKYQQTVDKGTDDVVSVFQFAGGCASDWVQWATTGVENGGRNA